MQELQLQNQLVAANDAAVAEAEEAAIMSDKAHTQVLVPLCHAYGVCLRMANAWTSAVESKLGGNLYGWGEMLGKACKACESVLPPTKSMPT